MKKNPLFVGIAEKVLAAQLNKLKKATITFFILHGLDVSVRLVTQLHIFFQASQDAAKIKNLKARFVRAATNRPGNNSKPTWHLIH